MHDIATIKAECKRDLDMLRKEELETHELLKAQIKEESLKEKNEMKAKFEMERQEAKEEYES